MCSHTYGGGIDQTAIIGHAPELRDWRPEHGDHGVTLGTNVRIEAYVTVDAGAHHPTRIGHRTWLMKKVHVGHDCLIGEDVEIAPGAVICGDVTLHDRVRVGVNASIRPGIVVGEGARIGAGAVVTKNVPAHEIWAGNPARPLGSKDEGFGRDGQSVHRLTAA